MSKLLSIDKKTDIFKKYFKGNATLVAKTWTKKDGTTNFTPICSNSGVPNICKHLEGKTCSECTNKNYKPWNDLMIMHHVQGDQKDNNGNIVEYGIYPLLENGVSCYFVAADFDDRPFSHVQALYNKLLEWGLQPTIFRSKNRGWHVYLYFSEPVEARHARAIMMTCFGYLNMYPSGDGKKMPEIFPKQSETTSVKQFGNLIRLPMMEHLMQNGRSCPVDEKDNPIGKDTDDMLNLMWDYLASRPTTTNDQLLKAIKDNDVEVKESASLFPRGPGNTTMSKYEKPDRGDFQKVVKNCLPIRKAIEDPFSDLVAHNQRMATVYTSINCSNGIEIIRDTYPAKDGEWATEEEFDEYGRKGSRKVEGYLSDAIRNNYKPVTCKHMIENGFCDKGEHPCFQKKPPMEMVDGKLVENSQNLPPEQWAEPSPIRFAYMNDKYSGENLPSDATASIDIGSSTVVLLDGKYCLRRWKKDDCIDNPITNFKMNLLECITAKDFDSVGNGADDSVTIFKAEIIMSETGVVYPIEYTSKDISMNSRFFDLVISATHGKAQLANKHTDLIVFMAHKCSSYKDKDVYSSGGYLGKNKYITKSVMITPDAITPNTEYMIQVPSGHKASNIDFRIADHEEVVRTTKMFVEAFLSLKRDSMSMILAHLVSPFVKEKIPSIKTMGQMLIGPSGIGKTALLISGLSLYGPGFMLNGNIPSASSTANYLEIEGHFFRGAIFPVSDQKLAVISNPDAYVRIFQNAYDGFTRGRCRSDLKTAQSFPIRGCPLIEGENNPFEGEASTSARFMEIEIDDNTKNTKAFNTIMDNYESFSCILPPFIKYMFSIDAKTVKQSWTEKRDLLRKKTPTEKNNTFRCAENYAFNFVCGKLFFDWCLAEGVLSKTENEYYVDKLNSQVERGFLKADIETSARNAGEMFIDAIKELVASGKYIIMGINSEDQKGKEIIGEVKGSVVYLLPTVCLGKVSEFYKTSNINFKHTNREIGKFLKQMDLIAEADSDGHNTKTKRMDSGKQRTFAIKFSAFGRLYPIDGGKGATEEGLAEANVPF